MADIKISQLTPATDLFGGEYAPINQGGETKKIAIGNMSLQNKASVNITGGSITGIADLAIADGGTGASTASGARTNLDVYSKSEVDTADLLNANNLTSHINDTVAAHDASAIANTPSGSIASTTVQGAINELASDIASLGTNSTGNRTVQSIASGTPTGGANGDIVYQY